ncbi:MAG: heat-inducible transcriptional repressor HrcA [Phormidesmis sp.]
MKLNPRQRNILRATVRHYVSTAEPVGSKSLAQGYDLQVSSATIRNVMSALETSGLLYQPHTSAGRIPSDSGYRTYVNELMTPSKPLTRQVESALNSNLDWERQAIEALLQESAQILSRLSGYIALVTLPQMEASLIKHLQLVRVSDRQILLVVLDVYNNHSILLRLPSSATNTADGSAARRDRTNEEIDRELQLLSNFLTAQLKGRSLHEADLDWAALDQAFQRYVGALQQAIADLARQAKAATTTQILVSGLAEALNQPEFAEREQIRTIVQLLEDGRNQLWPLIAEPEPTGALLVNQQRLRIWIGAENPVEPMRSCALVTSRYGNAPGPMGSLGVLGPTRMLYENAVAAVEAAANYLTDAVAETLGGDGRGDGQLTPEG